MQDFSKDPYFFLFLVFILAVVLGVLFVLIRLAVKSALSGSELLTINKRLLFLKELEIKNSGIPDTSIRRAEKENELEILNKRFTGGLLSEAEYKQKRSQLIAEING